MQLLSTIEISFFLIFDINTLDMLHSVGTCLWFDGKAKEAAHYYKEIFGEVNIISENPMAVVYTLFGRRFMNLNAGPGYPINPSISFYISVDTESEISNLWEKIVADGKILMPLNTYPWSEKYGWCADKFGVNWQFMLKHESSSKVMPHLLFTGNNAGKASEAILYYTSLFDHSKTIKIDTYQKGEPDVEGFIKYAQFEINDLAFGIMDSSAPHKFAFNEGVSFIITVDSQEEIDFYWNYLVKEGAPGRCGWLKDKYGISWQVVPSMLGRLMTNPATAPKATYAFLQMSKFILADLEKAVE